MIKNKKGFKIKTSIIPNDTTVDIPVVFPILSQCSENILRYLIVIISLFKIFIINITIYYF